MTEPSFIVSVTDPGGFSGWSRGFDTEAAARDWLASQAATLPLGATVAIKDAARMPTLCGTRTA